MNYFKYFPEIENQGKIWDLFSSLSDLSDVDYHCERRNGLYTMEIMSSARSGRISLDSEFNLKKYEAGCKENTLKDKRKKASKELHIVSFDDTDEDVRAGYGDISDRRLGGKDKEYGVVDDVVSWDGSVKKLLSLRRGYLIERGIDIVTLVYGASLGVYEAVRSLSNLMGTDSEILGLVGSLFGCGIPLSKVADRLRTEVRLQ